MNRLMKAEWYRVRHSSRLIKWLVAACVFAAVLPLLVDYEVLGKNLAENLIAEQEMTTFLPCLLSVFAATVVGIAYRNKTAYYEVMAGNKIYQIVFSKIFVDATLIAVSVFVSMGIYWIIIGCCNGTGGISQLPLRFLLLFVLFFHFCICGILMMTTFRQMAGIALVYLRFAVVGTFIALLVNMLLEGQLPEKIMARLADWFIIVKLCKIFRSEYEITGHLIFTVIAGMLIESGIWYAISYAGMKKKIYK